MAIYLHLYILISNRCELIVFASELNTNHQSLCGHLSRPVMIRLILLLPVQTQMTVCNLSVFAVIIKLIFYINACLIYNFIWSVFVSFVALVVKDTISFIYDF